MTSKKKTRIYDLARELKQDAKRVLEEARREGADISVPSNSISNELADKIRRKYFPKEYETPKRKIKLIRKPKKTPVEFDSSSKNKNLKETRGITILTKEKQVCKYCDAKVLVNRYKTHISTKCLKRPSLSHDKTPSTPDTKRPSSPHNKRSSSHYLREANYVIKALTKSKNESENTNNKNQKTCEFCFVTVSGKNYDEHILSKCLKRPLLSRKKSGEIDEQLQMKIEDLSWEIFPKGNQITKEEMFAKVSEHFDYLQNNEKWKNNFFDKSRLSSIEEKLNPIECFIGKDEFEGYIVYCFDWTKKVILECPIYGNATYIISKGKHSWKEIAKASKWEARTTYSEQVTVINHSETWLERLEQNLR